METKQRSVLEPRQLNEADHEILDELHKGRASPSYLAEQTGIEQTYINQRLRRLDEHGHVENLARGLWEIADDPRGTQPNSRYSQEDIESIREVLSWIEEKIEMHGRGQVEIDAENLAENMKVLESKLEEILDEVDADEHD